jgi:hypothetical protein
MPKNGGSAKPEPKPLKFLGPRAPWANRSLRLWLMPLQAGEKFFGTHFLHCHVSDIGLWRMTVYSMDKRWQHCQVTSFMSDLDVCGAYTLQLCLYFV